MTKFTNNRVGLILGIIAIILNIIAIVIHIYEKIN